ncbi:MAG: 6-phosphofructokinase [Candidatus Aenigmarchaeota archaeon]|nr:6-phosphofructokinase [Candidatus Aenigmarchaeota archaeon]
MKRICVLTSGGDAPGMNAAIRSILQYGIYKNLEIYGAIGGFNGLVKNKLIKLDVHDTVRIINGGGTILETLRCNEFRQKKGRKIAFETLKSHKIDGLIVIGGDGSFRGIKDLKKEWKFPCVGIPATIDNDIAGTDMSIGTDTAINTALCAIDKIRDTSLSMTRVFVVEVMGRRSGYLASQVALASAAEEMIIPEIKYDPHKLCAHIKEGRIRGKTSWIIIVAEGAASANSIAKQISKQMSMEVRVAVLGHIQRGGSPTAFDRVLATKMGIVAVKALLKSDYGVAVGIKQRKLVTYDISKAVFESKKDTIKDSYKLLKTLL